MDSRVLRRIVPLLSLVLAVAGCGHTSTGGGHGGADGGTGTLQSLRDLGRARGLLIGSAYPSTTDDPDYEARFLQQFGLMIPENSFKPRLIHPTETGYYFTATDYLVDYAEQHGLEIHGHTLVWGKTKSLPDWVANGTWTRDSLSAAITAHISTVVGRYKGRVADWDVVNEAFCDPAVESWCIVAPGEKGGMDGSVYRKTIGADFIEIALKAAHAADPQAKLYINDNGYEIAGSPKESKIESYVRDLVSRGVPLDGLGIQMHFVLDAPHLALSDAKWTDFLTTLKQSTAETFRRFNAMGLFMAITELDVALPTGSGAPSSHDLARQADVYQMALSVCLEAADCPSLNVWGFTDKYSWIPKAKPGYGAADIFDASLAPKPAFYALQDRLEQTP